MYTAINKKYIKINPQNIKIFDYSNKIIELKRFTINRYINSELQEGGKTCQSFKSNL